MNYLSRYEKNYRWLFEPEEVMPKFSILDTEKMFQKTSWGLMQVMGGVAREYGFRGWVTDLLDPVTNLKYGCTHLVNIKSRKNVKSLTDQIAAYNAGSPRRKAGCYVNQVYVDSVMDKIKHWEVSCGIPAKF